MMLQFADPGYFILLLLPIWLLFRRHTGTTLPFSSVQQLPSAQQTWRLRMRLLLPWIQAAGLSLLIVALARPQLVQAKYLQSPIESDVLFVLDVSNSMKALDLEPNRLEAAKKMMVEMVQERPFTRFGLILFAQQAYIQLPPTRDHALLLQSIEQIQTADQLGIPDGTSLGLGIATAAGLLADAPTANRTIIVFTDGVNNDKTLDPLVAADAAATVGIRIDIIVLGQTGLVPFPQQGLTGQYVVFWESSLDANPLYDASMRTNGVMMQAGDGRSLTQLRTTITNQPAFNTNIGIYEQTLELFWVLLWGGASVLLLAFGLHCFALRMVI